MEVGCIFPAAFCEGILYVLCLYESSAFEHGEQTQEKSSYKVSCDELPCPEQVHPKSEQNDELPAGFVVK